MVESYFWMVGNHHSVCHCVACDIDMSLAYKNPIRFPAWVTRVSWLKKKDDLPSECVCVLLHFVWRSFHMFGWTSMHKTIPQNTQEITLHHHFWMEPSHDKTTKHPAFRSRKLPRPELRSGDHHEGRHTGEQPTSLFEPCSKKTLVERRPNKLVLWKPWMKGFSVDESDELFVTLGLESRRNWGFNHVKMVIFFVDFWLMYDS